MSEPNRPDEKKQLPSYAVDNVEGRERSGSIATLNALIAEGEDLPCHTKI